MACGGVSANYQGVRGETERTDGNYGLHTYDNLYSNNYHTTGAIMQVAQNVGSDALEPGDVVAFKGIRRVDSVDARSGAPSWTKVLQAPIVEVARASATDTSGVAGVVFSRYVVRPEDLDGEAPGAESPRGGDPGSPTEAPQDGPYEVTLSGPAEPGDLVLVVVHGPAEVCVRPYETSIEPGDLLVAADVEGYATKAVAASDRLGPTPGTVFGKALERVDPERETIYAYVTLQ